MNAPVHVTVWGAGRTGAARAVLVHGTMTWGTDGYGFAAQRPLADQAELLRVEGASHWPHAERPEAVNAALRRLWRSVPG